MYCVAPNLRFGSLGNHTHRPDVQLMEFSMRCPLAAPSPDPVVMLIMARYPIIIQSVMMLFSGSGQKAQFQLGLKGSPIGQSRFEKFVEFPIMLPLSDMA